MHGPKDFKEQVDEGHVVTLREGTILILPLAHCHQLQTLRSLEGPRWRELSEYLCLSNGDLLSASTAPGVEGRPGFPTPWIQDGGLKPDLLVPVPFNYVCGFLVIFFFPMDVESGR